MFKKIIYTTLVVTLLLVSLSSGQQMLDKVSAIVDDGVILQSEVVQAAYLIAMQMQIDPAKDAKRFAELQQTALDNLINRKLLLIQAEKDTIIADERQVDGYLQQQMASNIQQVGGEDKLEEYFGTTISKIRRQFREEIEKNLIIQAIQQQKLSTVQVSRREVETYFTTMKDSIGQVNESVDISHLLIEAEPGEESKKEAMNKIVSIQNRVKEGADFAALAKEFSDDPGSATRGGDLGFMSRGDFVSSFERAAFALNAGEYSDVVESEYGYHIIKMEEKRGEKIHTRHVLITPKPTEDDERTAAKQIMDIHEQLLDGADFFDFVEKYSMDTSTKEQKGHLGKFEVDQLRETAKEFTFALNEVEPGEYSDPVKTNYGFHVLKLNSKESARELSLEKDWDRLEAMSLEYKKQKQFQKILDEIRGEVYIEVKSS
jgi:peptidyl-prolyl cis-trans isomerase SurA